MKLFALIWGVPAVLAAVHAVEDGTSVPNSWIVVLRKDAPQDALPTAFQTTSSTGMTATLSFDLGSEYFRGYSVQASRRQMEKFEEANRATVAYVQQDRRIGHCMVDHDQLQKLKPTHKKPKKSKKKPKEAKTMEAKTMRVKTKLYNLHRISHMECNASEPRKWSYDYDDSAGSGIYAYVLDTGINIADPEFEGRASYGVNYVKPGRAGRPNSLESNKYAQDFHGHGTHVAAVIGARSYGVAKKTELIAVKVMGDDGRGEESDLIKGLEWTVKDIERRGRTGKSVINMSCGAPLLGRADPVGAAVKAAVDRGHFVAVAAGNKGRDARYTTPASTAEACTVGSIDVADNFSPFSNWGKSVDISAPGEKVFSLGLNGKSTPMWGTSMASPHIAGLAAYILAKDGIEEPISLCKHLKRIAIPDAIRWGKDGPRGTLDYIAFNSIGMEDE